VKETAFIIGAVMLLALLFLTRHYTVPSGNPAGPAPTASPS
jgi:hypothetical protein